jgi:hypothetical protein
MTLTAKLRIALLATACASPALLGVARAQPPGDGEHRGPPTAMFDACKDKKAGDTCEVTFREHKLSGKCAAFPNGKIGCRVAPPAELLKACEGKKEGDACSATTERGKVEGSCRKGRMDDRLVCRMPRPERP